VTSTKLESGQDVVSFLVEQHQQIKSLFEQVSSARGEERREAFTALRRLLAVHETAEEEIVHPRARKEIENGASVVDARLQEENEAKQTLSQLEKMDVDSADFEKLFEQFHADVLEHATNEEQQEFPLVRRDNDADRLAKLGTAMEKVEKVAPTHPHPSAKTTAANAVLGPFASILDRTRDAIAAALKD
jgi:hemerythrin superfamily protein